MSTRLEGTGFIAPAERNDGQERGTTAIASLIASIVLALGTIVAATVVTVGIARAGAADSVIDNEGSLFAVALLLGLLFIGISGISFVIPRRRTHR
jgi:high-affinity Fe2+/Pb2+ permease